MNYYSLFTFFKNGLLSLLLITFLYQPLQGQFYWQQEVNYNIEVELNVKKNCMDGEIELVYTNNSPDTLDRLFFHLYYNAFQPNSMMDMRSRTISDPDRRVASRIYNLNDKEEGFHKIKSMKQSGSNLDYMVDGTILDVQLNTPIYPGDKTQIFLKFESQIPIQIRRTGRDNQEGIRYSMSQWYPKLCEYDYDGWHPNPYVGREFYGVWGDFKVSITLDNEYMVAAGGTLVNDINSQSGKNRTWIFEANRIHDFVWAADPDFTHDVATTDDGIDLHFYYQPGENTTDNWVRFQDVMKTAFDFIQKKYGKYPYDLYAFIQGGDGGMEYPLATLITGERSYISLVGVSIHELLHSWYQALLATNESLFPWMDEGFTSYTSNEVMNYLKEVGAVRGYNPVDNPHSGSMTGYRNFAKTPFEEPLSTHADHYKRNQAYGIGAYVKGVVFLDQLSYIIGRDVFDKTLIKFFNTWQFRHPDIYDFIRVAEKESGMILDWYIEKWVQTTDKIDYSIDTVFSDNKKATVMLSNKGDMMMPLDVVVRTKNGDSHLYNIPLHIMRGSKPDEGHTDTYNVSLDWKWTHPTYKLETNIDISEIDTIEIDNSNRLADINTEDNIWPRN